MSQPMAGSPAHARDRQGVVVGSYLLCSLPSLDLVHGQLAGRFLRRHLQLGDGDGRGGERAD